MNFLQLLHVAVVFLYLASLVEIAVSETPKDALRAALNALSSYCLILIVSEL